ncbi:hypothetical protein D4764_14G0012650 [Takifugu flavidus]|uniref:Uncharacterized protein n=1 Tax=Takifugu flavidus TaxID=433684 RepID=A0A5C6P6G7_9TELE|nr:hypothetical protein D4764_14G0012650 [Takifugu flavidus]
MKSYCLLLSITLSCCCSAEGAPLNNQPAAITGVITSPVLSVNETASPNKDSSKPVMLIPNQQQEADIPDLLKQVVLVQKELAHGQVQVIQKLSAFEKQDLFQDLQNMACHQSLLVENNQALLLQTSRIASLLQDITKNPPDASQ